MIPQTRSKMEIEVTKKTEIKDGVHQGTIIDVEYRDTPYSYTDLVIEFPEDMQVLKLKAGYPTIIQESSKLGKLLARFGAKLEVGVKVDPDKTLISKKCQFQTITEETKNGTFARILSESVKPVE